MVETLDIPGIIYAVIANEFDTIVGDSTALTTNDGNTSYLEIDKPDSGGSFTGYQLEIQFPATSIPGTLLTTSMVTVAYGDHSNASAFGIRIPPDSVSRQWDDPFAEAALYTEKVTPMTYLGAEVVTQDMIEAGEVQWYTDRHTVLFNDVDDDPIYLRVTYIALRITYEPLLDTVVRQYPRDDGRGMSSAPRLYPPSKADRIVGGYQ